MNRHPRKISFLLTILAAVLTLVSCAGYGSLANMVRPQVDVTDVKVLGTTLTGADLLFQFRVDNPNAVGLVLDAIGYRLRLNDQPLLDGRRDQQLRIGANGRSVVELPVTIRYEDVYRVIRSFSNRERPDYALDADFRFDVPILGAINVPVTKRGEIPLDRLRIGK
jgi:LEA14-like dessication related protein